MLNKKLNINYLILHPNITLKQNLKQEDEEIEKISKF